MFKSYIYISLFLILQLSAYSQKGRVEGRVFDETNNEPLPFSNVLIKGTQIGSMTDFDGKFIITNVDAGFISLEVRSLGYETIITSELQITSNRVAYIDVAMKKSSLQLAEVSITAKQFIKKEESPVSLRTISISEIENSAGANRDISKVIQSFPGVAAFPAANRNDIIVRGGGSNESRFYLDGIEIPNINHFATQGASGGTNGILNADFMREVDFYSGAFPASRGNALSAVFDFKQIDGNPDKIRYKATLGASETGLTVDGPTSEKNTIILSARRSYLQFLFKAIGLPFLPTYNDYQVKSRYRIDSKNEITFISIGAYDVVKLDTDIKNPTENQLYILNNIPVIDQWNYAVGSVYRNYRDNGYSSYVLSRNMLKNSSYKYINNDESKSENLILNYSSSEIENKFRYENLVFIENGPKIEYGIGLEQSKYFNNTYQKIYTPISGFQTIDFNSELTFYKYAGFGQISHKFLNSRLSMSLGIRTDANTYSNKMLNPLPQISPRISASYALSEKININASTGRFYQLPGYTSLGYRDSQGVLVNKNNGIKYIKADHIVGGLEWLPNSNIRIANEYFLKLYNNYLFSINDSISLAHRPIDFGSVGSEPVSSDNKGRVYGSELLFQYKLSSKSSIVASYTYSISEFIDKNGKYKPASWDNKHTFIVSGNRKFNKNWSGAVKWRFAGGLPYTPYDIDKSSVIAAWELQGRPYFDFNQLNSKRFTPFHQLDARIDKSFYFKKSSLKLYLDIQNLYNFKSQELDRVTNLDINGNPIVDINNPLRYNLRVIKNEGSGLILPTIGLIFDF